MRCTRSLCAYICVRLLLWVQSASTIPSRNLSMSKPMRLSGYACPTRKTEKHNPSLAPRVKAFQPIHAWDDPQAECLRSDARRNDDHHRQRESQSSFYDRESLQEQLRSLHAESIVLTEKKQNLDLRLANAQTTLSDTRAKKRDLSQAKLIDEAAAVSPARAKPTRAAGPRAAFRRDRATDVNGSGSSTRKARTNRSQENANVRSGGAREYAIHAHY